MTRILFCILIGSLGLLGCESPRLESTGFDDVYMAKHEEWKDKRLSELTAEEGYLSLAGFYWLEDGTYKIGTGTNMDIVFPAGSSDEYLGDLSVTDDTLASFQIAPGVEIFKNEEAFTNGRLDIDGKKTSKLRHKRSNFYPIKRNEKLALRLEWFDVPTRSEFKGLDFFDLNPDLVVDAKFVRYDSPRKVKIGNVKDYISTEISEGELLVQLFGDEYRLQSMAEESDGRYFIIFGDQTNGKSTYGGGRFIWVDAPDDEGNTTIDFNKAYNPACAFTVFSTCPIPPAQNRISGSIIAGERKYIST